MGFWTYESASDVNFMFNKNHLVVILFSLVIIVFLSMYACRKSLKFQRICIAVLLILAIILQGLRIFWRYKFLENTGEVITFLKVAEPSFFLVSFLISVPILIFAIFKKKREDSRIFGLSFVYNVATLNGIISLIYPNFMVSNFEIYHFCNLSSVLVRSFVITIGVILAFSKWIPLGEYLDLYRAIFSLLFFGVICAILGFVLKGDNLFYVDYCPIFETLGLSLNFPFQYIVLGVFMFMFQCLMYLPFRLKKKKEEN